MSLQSLKKVFEECKSKSEQIKYFKYYLELKYTGDIVTWYEVQEPTEMVVEIKQTSNTVTCLWNIRISWKLDIVQVNHTLKK